MSAQSKKDLDKQPRFEAPPASRLAWWQGRCFLGLALMVLVLLAYQSVWRAGFIWDDDAYVTQNPLLTRPDGLKEIWFSQHRQSQYFPLVYTTLRAEHALWEVNPIGYHLVNILLHGANAWLVWLILLRLKVPGAWLAAAVFALHPVQVETVAWVTELKNTESTLFYLLAVLAWFKFIDRETPKPWFFYLLALGLHALALFAKTTACTLPAALVLVLWLRKETINARRLAQIIPFLLLGVVMGLVSIWWEGHLGNYTAESGAEYGWLGRLLIATRALWFYAGKVAWPVNLMFSYPKWEIDTHAAMQFVWLAACLILAAWLWWKRKHVGRGVIAGVVFFVAALSPLIGFIWLYTMRYSFVADHHQYLACLGLIAPAAAAASLWTINWTGIARRASAALLLLLLGALTWTHALAYRNLDTLWQATLAKNPASWLAHDNLGTMLLSQGQTNEALAHFEQSLAVRPQDEVAWNNIGFILLNQGQTEAAIADFEKSIACQPNYSLARYNLGGVLMQHGHLEEALAQFHEAVRLQPDNASYHNNLGNALRQAGRADEAMAEFQAALQIDADDPVAQNNFGEALCRAGRFGEAVPYFQRALQLDPNYASANNNLGNILFQSGKLEPAIYQYLKALVSRPDYPDAHNNLGVCLFSKGEVAEAIVHWRRALELNPRYANAANNLAWVLATCPDDSVRNGPEALALATQAARLSGGQDPMVARTLAAAYAENGRFTEAIGVTRNAITVAGPNLASALQEQLKSYEAGKPYRDNSQSDTSPRPANP